MSTFSYLISVIHIKAKGTSCNRHCRSRRCLITYFCWHGVETQVACTGDLQGEMGRDTNFPSVGLVGEGGGGLVRNTWTGCGWTYQLQVSPRACQICFTQLRSLNGKESRLRKDWRCLSTNNLAQRTSRIHSFGIAYRMCMKWFAVSTPFRYL
jgi:hypothetical protein